MPPVPRVQPQLPQAGHPSLATISSHRQGKNLDVFENQSPATSAKKEKESKSKNEEIKTTKRPPRTHNCADCDFITTSEKVLRAHGLKMHNTGNVIICVCGFIFLNKDHYKSHLNLVTNPKQEDKLKEIVKKKKKELNLKDYKWIHNKTIRAPKPENAEHVSFLSKNKFDD